MGRRVKESKINRNGDLDRIYGFWEGRLLLDQEVDRMRTIHFPTMNQVTWENLLCQWHKRKWIKFTNAVSIGLKGKWLCNRCGATEEYMFYTQCGRCGKENCASCRHCILLGRARSCSILYQFVRDQRELASRKTHSVSVSLTSQQTSASQQLFTYIKSKEPTILFWAVTGAGKTETMIPIIHQTLQEGKSVLWCTPRQDVVKELAPRLKPLFPVGWVTEHYGGSPDAGILSPLVLSTAHQTIRMVQRFDLVILDEADAFPLEKNQALEYTVRRSMRIGGSMILLTATPTDSWIRYMRRGELPAVLLPQRYHGHPLPCPIWKRDRALWRQIQNQKASDVVHYIIREIEKTDGQALWFVPRIEDVGVVSSWLKKQFPQLSEVIDEVSSVDEDRTAKVIRFRKGEIQHLVTTTILERGVTVPRCHVVVVKADHYVYDRATLVQISGRVGRSSQYQAGKVWFLSNDKTEPICQAIREIQLLNREAVRSFRG